MSEQKWKFILIETGISSSPRAWWLRIDNPDDVARYLDLTQNRFGDALVKCCHLYYDSDRGEDRKREARARFSHSGNELAQSLDVLHRNSGNALLEDAGMFYGEACHTYFKTLARNGYVNINKDGGCNGIDWPIAATVFRDELVFPCFTEDDIKIETMEMSEMKYTGEFRPGYHYHYYASIGGVQVRDGDIIKWDTREEAAEAAKRYIVRRNLVG